MTQRWRDHRESYRPRGEPVDSRRYEVAEITEAEAKAFILQHHYAGTYPAARVRVGLHDLHRRGELVGAAVFSQPATQAVLDILPAGRDEGTELGRLVLLDEVAANGETLFLAQSFARLRHHGITGVVSHADPFRLERADGEAVTPGHVGTIYQALNGIYTGRARARWRWLLPSGRIYSERAIAKVRSGDRGWRYAAAQLVEAGAPPPPDLGARAWVDEWLPRLCRRFRHPGNHRYVWAIDQGAGRLARRGAARALERHLADRRVRTDLARPKEIDLAA